MTDDVTQLPAKYRKIADDLIKNVRPDDPRDMAGQNLSEATKVADIYRAVADDIEASANRLQTRVSGLDFSLFYYGLYRAVMGNGTVHFDSDAMAKEPDYEPWVRYFAEQAVKITGRHVRG